MANRVIYTKLPNGQVERVVVGGAGGVGGGATGNSNTGAGALSPTMKTAYKDLAKSNSLTPSSTTATPQKINSSTVKQTVTQAAATAPSLNSSASGTNGSGSTNNGINNSQYSGIYNNMQQMAADNAAQREANARARYGELEALAYGNDEKWKSEQQGLYDAFVERERQRQADDVAASNAEYDRNARQNYINYMQAQKQLPSQLNALGIRGGAAESSLIRLGSNYGTNVANNNMARAQALDNLAKQYADRIYEAETQLRKAFMERDDATANMLTTQYNQMLSELDQIEAARDDLIMEAYSTAAYGGIDYDKWLQQFEREGNWRKEDIAREDTQRAEDQAIAKEQTQYERGKYDTEYGDAFIDKKVEQYAAGLTRYQSVDTLEKIIKNIKKNNPKWEDDRYDYGRVMACEARIGEIKAAKK